MQIVDGQPAATGSPSLRRRGLKSLPGPDRLKSVRSPSLRRRGLKSPPAGVPASRPLVAVLATAWIEISVP